MSSPRHVFVFDNARSSSNLLGKLFSAHPDLVYSRHPYQLAMTPGPEKIGLGVSAATVKDLMQKASTVPPELARKWGSVTFEDCHGKLTALVEGAEQANKRAWISEHACYCMREDFALASLRQTDAPPSGDTNPTHIPELTERMLGVEDETFDFWIHLQYSKYIFEYFADRHRRDPNVPPASVVVDVEDVVRNTDRLTLKLCQLCDIPAHGVRHTWSVAGDEEPVSDGIHSIFHERLRQSVGIERGPAEIRDEDIDVDVAEREWRKEFGVETADILRAKVDAQMPVYWDLWARKLNV